MQKGNVYHAKGFSRQRIGKIADVSETAFTCRLHTLLYVRSKCFTSCLLQISAASRQFPHRTHPLVPIILSPLRSSRAEPVSAVSPIVKGGSNRMRTRQYIKIRPLSLQPPRRLICGDDLWTFALWNVQAVALCRDGKYTNRHKLLVNILWYLQPKL